MKGLLLSLVLSPVLFAQISSGTLYGRAQDQSGGSLSGVHVTIRQEKTGFLRNTVTDDSGSYRVPDIAPGVYSLTAERAGFKTFIASNVTLEIDQQARFDFTLDVGRAHESITVDASVSLLQTDDNSEGYPNYGIPGHYPDLSSFGQILSTGQPRRMQFGTRFDF